jgi:hypothetical protein
MRRLHLRSTRRSAMSKLERSWLGAEALPGGALPREAEHPVRSETTPPAPTAAGGGPAVWLAAALRWLRRGRLT